MWGLISASQNSRTDCCTSRFSSDGRRSITREFYGGPDAKKRRGCRRRRFCCGCGPCSSPRWLSVVVEEAADVLQEEPPVTALADAVILQLAAIAQPLDRVDVEMEHLRDLGCSEHLSKLVQSHRAHPCCLPFDR